jgi:hypothetical protein
VFEPLDGAVKSCYSLTPPIPSLFLVPVSFITIPSGFGQTYALLLSAIEISSCSCVLLCLLFRFSNGEA